MPSRLLPILLLLAAASLQANVRLPHILSSHMVLQRNRPLHFWGWAYPGEADRKFVPAAARIEGTSIVVSSAVVAVIAFAAIYCMPPIP